MKKISKILFPTDFSESSANAFRYAVQFADHVGASLEILHIVFPEGESMDYPILTAKATQSRIKISRERLKKFIDTGLASLEPAFKNKSMISSDLEIGTPIQSICSIAKRNNTNMIILGSRGTNRSTLDKLIGSVATGVVGKAHCPVMVIPDDAIFKNIESITYATDVKNADPFEIWQAQETLKPFKPKVELVHVNLKKAGDSEAWKKMEEMKKFFEDRAPDTPVHLYNIPGNDLQVELNHFIDNHDTDLLVMYQPHHSFWDRLFFKSDTKGMTLHTKIPLLVQKE